MEEISRTFSAHTPNTVIGVGAVDSVATLTRQLTSSSKLYKTNECRPEEEGEN